jgi:Uma2 family endonuclease
MTSTYPQRVRWTRSHVKVMLEANVFAPHQVELIQGDIIQKMPQNQPHAVATRCTTKAMEGIFDWENVGSASPIIIDEENSPEPDVFVTKSPLSIYTDNPQATECVLVVEVSDSTLAMDKTTKATLYAKAGILEYWIVNINAQTVIVHREPSSGEGEAGYGNIQTYDNTKSIATLAKPERMIAVADLLP